MRLTASVVAFALLLGAAAPAIGGERLNSEEVKAKIVGNTITIVTPDLKTATGYVEPGSKIRGHIGADDFEGTWSIRDDGEICFDLPVRTFDICRVVFDDGEHVRFFTTTGDPAGRADVLPGNPYNF